jgi:glycosyltransferase involved in cell wall biosynthesis
VNNDAVENNSPQIVSSAPDLRDALPAALPHVAYILLWYPLFTQPFIFREVENLKLRLPVEIYSLYGLNPRHCSREMLAAAPLTRTAGLRMLPVFLLEILRCLLVSPGKFCRLFARSLFRRWQNLESFAENFWAFCAGIRLGRQLLEDGIDLVYAPWPRGTATAAWVAADIAGIPFATSARGDNLEPADPDLGSKFAAALFIRANNAADLRRIEKFDREQARDKTELVYNSLTLPEVTERPVPILTQNPVRLLALGRFDVTKGFDVLLRSCAILKKEGFDFRLTLAGGGGKIMGLGGMGRTILAMWKELGLEDRVAMPGIISHDKLPEFLFSHDIFVAPCIVHASGRRDGIPNTVIEAFAYGLPVVGTNVNALPEVILHHETGLLVPPGNAQSLAEAVMWLGNNPAEARIMGQNGMALARRIFNPVHNNKLLADIFIRRHAAWKQMCAE